MNAVPAWLLVACGGALGALVRWRTGSWLIARAGESAGRYGTLAVNVLGCLAIGLVLGRPGALEAAHVRTRLLVVVGLLGGLTTFSSFGFEVADLWRRGLGRAAFLHLLLTNALGLGAVFVGLRLAARPG